LIATAMTRRPTLTDDEILRRARSVFVERGYAARTRQIAAAVGLTWGAIALRFNDKRELFRRAMARPNAKSCELELEQAGAADLPGLLERVRSYLWEQWPRRLQYRLAMPSTDQDREPDRLVEGLAGALETHARGGAVRSDMSGHALAQIVLALLVGDVAQRFVAHETTLTSDRTFIEGVMFLLSGR
jgi:AcrR family transcriptional regulator